MTNEQADNPRVFLVIVDATPEMRAALRYAARRALRTGGRVALLRIVDPPEGQHWRAMEELMRVEHREEAEQVIAGLSVQLVNLTGTPPVVYIREGEAAPEILAQINEEPSISVLVLAAAVGASGPGPLVSMMSNRLMGKLRVPLIIVPGSLSDEDIDLLT